MPDIGNPFISKGMQAMKQLTSNVWVETEVRGCNFGFVTTSEGIVMIDSPHKPSTALWLKAEIEKRGLLRYIINTEPHGDHWTGNAFFDAPVIAHEGVRTRILNTDMAEHAARIGTFGPQEPALLEGLRGLDEDIFVPGHGALCGKDYLDEQGEFIIEWKDYVQDAIDRGLTREEAVSTLTAMTERYPMDVEQEGMAPMVMHISTANLYDYLTGPWPPAGMGSVATRLPGGSR